MSKPGSLIGKIIDGKYRIIEKLGGGGMGSVYKAEHSLLNHPVAIKFLHPHLALDEEYLKRFHREARTACKIKHPNAITLHDFGIADDYPFLAMEFIEGETLKAILKEDESLSTERIYSIITQIAGALSEAHELKIIHRDLKPENIMVSKRKDGSDWAKVLDFGIAKVLQGDNHPDPIMTQTGTVFGSPKYMAPEQALEQGVDTRADLYSLGVVLYEMLARRVPFEIKSVMQAVLKHANERPLPLKEITPKLDISQAVNDVVMKLLEKDPNDRYSTVEEFLLDFEGAFGPRDTVREEILATQRLSIWQNPSSRRILLFALLIVALLLGYIEYIKSSSDTTADLQRIEELDALKAKKEEELKQATTLAEQKRAEALEAGRRAEEKKAEALEAELIAEREKIAARQAAEEAEHFRSLRQEEAEKTVALKAEVERAVALAEEQQRKADLAIRQAESLKEEAGRAAAEKVKAERAALEAEKRKVKQLRRQTIEQRKKLAAEQAKNLAIQKQAAATKAAIKPTPVTTEEEPEKEKKRRLPRQGKRRF